jgi:hypothetical protein
VYCSFADALVCLCSLCLLMPLSLPDAVCCVLCAVCCVLCAVCCVLLCVPDMMSAGPESRSLLSQRLQTSFNSRISSTPYVVLLCCCAVLCGVFCVFYVFYVCCVCELCGCAMQCVCHEARTTAHRGRHRWRAQRHKHTHTHTHAHACAERSHTRHTHHTTHTHR